jgi:hypothetical protein
MKPTPVSLPAKPEIERAVEEIAAAVVEDVAASYARLLEEHRPAEVSAFVLCTNDDGIPPYAMAALSSEFRIVDGQARDDFNPADWSWNDTGGSFRSGEIIDRILNSEEVAPDSLKGWYLRACVSLRGMLEGLKRFHAGGHFKSELPRDEMLLLLWIHDSEHRKWMVEWVRELNPPAAADWFKKAL